ncbi:hypothetical protein [Thiolapillus sp.]
MSHAPETAARDADAVVFWLWRNLAYRKRMLSAFGLILLGLLLQWYSGEVFAGFFPLVAGNALLLVRGYDNRTQFAGFSPSSQWQRVERSRLTELKDFDKKIRRWDRSFIDITNIRGVISFLLLVFLLVLMYVGFRDSRHYQQLVAIPIDMAILFLPHWFTGTRRILRLPGLLIKAETLEKALNETNPEDQGLKLDVLMLLKGEAKLPDDIKIRIEPADAPQDFLGLYGQVVLNNVQGKSYPYFYVVLVARPGLGLKELRDRIDPPDKTVVEFREQDGVEVLVLRQFTTKRSGYLTTPDTVRKLLRFGMEQMHRLLGEPLIKS